MRRSGPGGGEDEIADAPLEDSPMQRAKAYSELTEAGGDKEEQRACGLVGVPKKK